MESLRIIALPDEEVRRAGGGSIEALRYTGRTGTVRIVVHVQFSLRNVQYQ
jgi:hypothetical protein